MACHQIIGAKLDAGAFGARAIQVLFASGHSVPPEATHDDRGGPGQRSCLDIIKGLGKRITTDDHMGHVMAKLVEPPRALKHRSEWNWSVVRSAPYRQSFGDPRSHRPRLVIFGEAPGTGRSPTVAAGKERALWAGTSGTAGYQPRRTCAGISPVRWGCCCKP
jgi:hypothetical protein